MRRVLTVAAVSAFTLAPLSAVLAGETPPVPRTEAVTATAPAAKPKPPAAKNDDKLVCQSVRNTGSRFPERICKTRRQMQADREQARQNTDNAQSRSPSGY